MLGGARRWGRSGAALLLSLSLAAVAGAAIRPSAAQPIGREPDGEGTVVEWAAARPIGAEVPGVTSQITWTTCGARLECARVRVPLDWSRPHGPTIFLPVIRHLASRPESRIGSLFVNAGGAAGSVEAVRAEGASLDALGGGRFDVVGWALRGTGGSRTVRCFDDERSRAGLWNGEPIPTTRSEGRRYLPRTVKFATRCGELNGDLLAHVSTADDARDLDLLRRLVGDKALTYRAVSYGTFLGQTYANLYPDRVRAMVLDGLVDPRIVVRGAEARFADTVVGMDPGLARFASACQAAGPDRCALAGASPVATRVDRLLARLRLGPIPAPTARPAGPLGYGDVLTALFVTLTNSAACAFTCSRSWATA